MRGARGFYASFRATCTSSRFSRPVNPLGSSSRSTSELLPCEGTRGGVVRFRLIPHDRTFLEDLVVLGGELRKGARLLDEMLAPDHPVWDKADEIEAIEHRCDSLTHGIIERLDRTFVTPIDREDIHELASSVDDVVDAVDHCAAGVRLYRIQKVLPAAPALVR